MHNVTYKFTQNLTTIDKGKKMKKIKYLPISIFALTVVNAQSSDIHAKDFLPLPATTTYPVNDENENLPFYPTTAQNASSLNSMYRNMRNLEETVDELRAEVNELKSFILFSKLIFLCVFKF